MADAGSVGHVLAPKLYAIQKQDEKELVDVILTEYYPYKWVNKAMRHFKLKMAVQDQIGPSGEDDDPQGDPARNNNESNVEKWILVAFCSICILAMIVCIIVLIVYKVRKSRR